MGDFVYTGQENLEAMKEADNYNRYLLSILTKELDNVKSKSPSILDFGAGIGTYADMLKEKGFSADCLELDRDQIALLKNKGYKVYDSLSKAPKKYDLIYSFNVFEHIENDKEIFNELTNHLKAGAVIVTYVPAMQIAYSSMDKHVGHHRR